MYEQIVAFLKENQLASGGLIITIFGAVLAYLRNLPGQLWAFAKRRLVLEVEILDRDPAYAWFVKYIHRNKFCHKSRKLTAVTVWEYGYGYGMPSVASDDADDEEIKEPEIFLIPAPGYHFFWYRGIPMLLNMERNEGAGTGEKRASVRQNISITTLYRFKGQVEHMLEQARTLEVSKEKEKPVLKVLLPSYDTWCERGKCEKRDLESVILDGNGKEEIIRDIEIFLGSKEWYNRVGIPYKRGYLLYGPPGNGKTSLVKAIASKFDMKLCVLSLEGLMIGGDTSLPNLFQDIPKKSILLIEDIDCAVGKRDDPRNKVGMSVLLGCLDGISSPEGKLFFMTTNFIRKLDDALVRSGRCDYKLYLGNANKYMVLKMFEKFYPGLDVVKRLDFNERTLAVPEGGISVSIVQEHLLKNRDSWKEAADAWDGLFR